MKFSGPKRKDDLAGKWLVDSWLVRNNDLWDCRYVSKNKFNCGGNKVTLSGKTVTWVEKGFEQKGKLHRSDGSKKYDTIKWRDGSSDWKKQGIYDMNDTDTIFDYL